jgi:VWFA-related protein
MIGKTAYAQDCAGRIATTDMKEPTPTGEWLLTKYVTEVNVLFVATSRGRYIRDLSQEDISIQDDNKPPSAILRFRTEQGLPLRIGLAIDTSNSVTSRFRFEQAAASAFFHEVMDHNVDLGFVMGFQNQPYVSQDFIGDPDLLAKGVEQLTTGGGTALYDAVLAASQKLRRRPENDMVARVLVVLSDGLNNASAASLDRAIDAAQEGEVTIYAISTNYTASSSEAAFDTQVAFDAKNGNKNLRQLAEQTGGLVLRPRSPNDVTKAFEKIGQELRSRYAVSYKPADFKPDGHFRTIKIEAQTTGRKLQVRTRKGYYAISASRLSPHPPNQARALSLRQSHNPAPESSDSQ